MSYLSYARPFDENLLMLLVRDHHRYLPIVEFFDTATRELSELSWPEAEWIAKEISNQNRSGFCAGLRNGVTRALGKGAVNTDDAKLKAALAFALKVNQDASSITQADVDALTAQGWSEQTVEDLVGLVAIQKFYNVIASALGFKSLPDEVFNGIGEDTVNSGGYITSFRQFINQRD